MKLRKLKSHNGFTLVEILVVVIIIGILGGFISAAAYRGLTKAKVARNSLELHQISMALNNYKQQFGEYPPDFAGLDDSDGHTIRDEARLRVLRHVYRAFPRFTIPGVTPSDTDDQKWTKFRNHIYNNSEYTIGTDTTRYHIDLNKMNAANALVFWLAGMPDEKGRLSGFSKDPADPFAGPSTVASRIGPLYEFDPNRIYIKPNGEIYRYYPHGMSPGAGKPYVYFRAETSQDRYYAYCSDADSKKKVKTWTDETDNVKIINCAKPYWDDTTKYWVKTDSFQILCCGMDGKFGKENIYKSARFDNVKNDVPDGDKQAGIVDLRKYVIGIDSKVNPNGDDFPAGNFDHLDDQTNFDTGTIGDDLP